MWRYFILLLCEVKFDVPFVSSRFILFLFDLDVFHGFSSCSSCFSLLLEFLQTFIGTPWLSPRMAVGCSPWPQRREKDPKDPAVVAMS